MGRITGQWVCKKCHKSNLEDAEICRKCFQQREMKSKFNFKEAKLPDPHNTIEFYKDIVLEFSKTGIGVSDITEINKKLHINSMFQGIRKAIRVLGLSGSFFVTSRKKKCYIINIKVSGIKYVRPSRKYEKRGLVKINGKNELYL